MHCRQLAMCLPQPTPPARPTNSPCPMSLVRRRCCRCRCRCCCFAGTSAAGAARSAAAAAGAAAAALVQLARSSHNVVFTLCRRIRVRLLLHRGPVSAQGLHHARRWPLSAGTAWRRAGAGRVGGMEASPSLTYARRTLAAAVSLTSFSSCFLSLILPSQAGRTLCRTLHNCAAWRSSHRFTVTPSLVPPLGLCNRLV